MLVHTVIVSFAAESRSFLEVAGKLKYTKNSWLRSFVLQFLKMEFCFFKCSLLAASSLVFISYLCDTVQWRCRNMNKELNYFLFCVDLNCASFLKENLKFLNFFNFLRLQRNKIFSFISPAHIFNISFDLDLFAH